MLYTYNMVLVLCIYICDTYVYNIHTYLYMYNCYIWYQQPSYPASLHWPGPAWCRRVWPVPRCSLKKTSPESKVEGLGSPVSKVKDVDLSTVLGSMDFCGIIMAPGDSFSSKNSGVSAFQWFQEFQVFHVIWQCDTAKWDHLQTLRIWKC